MLPRLIHIRSLATNTKTRVSTANANRYIPKSTASTLKPSTSASSTPARKHETSRRSIRRGMIWASAVFLAWHTFTSYVLQTGPCHGISMLPTFNSFGDAVLVSMYYRRGRGVQVGDVVSFKHPLEPETTGLKRVVGMEGDFVLRDTPGIGVEEREEKMLQVPQGHCWVVGDNLEHSRDSRIFGPLPMALIKGKAIRRFPKGNVFSSIKLEGLTNPEPEDDVD